MGRLLTFLSNIKLVYQGKHSSLFQHRQQGRIFMATSPGLSSSWSWRQTRH
jgi:hypothetical protein